MNDLWTELWAITGAHNTQKTSPLTPQSVEMLQYMPTGVQKGEGKMSYLPPTLTTHSHPLHDAIHPQDDEIGIPQVIYS